LLNKKNVHNQRPLVDTIWLTQDSLEITESEWQAKLQHRLDMCKLQDRLELEKDKIDLLTKVDTYKRIIREEFLASNIGIKQAEEIQRAIANNEVRIHDISNILKLYDL